MRPGAISSVRGIAKTPLRRRPLQEAIQNQSKAPSSLSPLRGLKTAAIHVVAHTSRSLRANGVFDLCWFRRGISFSVRPGAASFVLSLIFLSFSNSRWGICCRGGRCDGGAVDYTSICGGVDHVSAALSVGSGYSGTRPLAVIGGMRPRSAVRMACRSW